MASKKQKPPKIKKGRKRFGRSRRVKQDGEPSAMDLVEEGMHLLRQVSITAWTVYFCGVAPFVFGFLFFWSEMSSSGLAERSLVPGAMGLGVLFIWFKVTQSFFADCLRSALIGAEAPAWRLRDWLKVVRLHSFWQSTSLIVLPIAFVATLPFPYVYAFYQNLLLVDPRGELDDDDASLKRNWRLARMWNEQSWVLLTALSLVFLLSFINWITVLMTVPFLLKTLLGIETVFSRSGAHLMNSMSLFVCVLLAYVVTDPLIRAVYMLRRHYCESRRSGADLRLRFRLTLPAKASLIAIGFLIGSPLFCPEARSLSAKSESAIEAPTTVNASDLDASIDRVMERREFVWRFPRDEVEEGRDQDANWLKDFIEMIERWQEKLDLWLEEFFGKDEAPSKSRDWDGLLGLGSALSYLLIGLFVLLLVYFGVRAFRMYQPLLEVEGSATPEAEAVPDLNAEDVAADVLPRNKWVELARDLIAKGDYRLALRAYFLAQLSALSSEGLVVIRLSKSNREYAKELGRRAHGQVALPYLYRKEMRLFESVWYGSRISGPEEISEMESYLAETGVLS
ncbi:MAG: hypothetical protein ACSHYA_06930 [Opitutaceae bacterium]